jgi:hypothetical protein
LDQVYHLSLTVFCRSIEDAVVLQISWRWALFLHIKPVPTCTGALPFFSLPSSLMVTSGWLLEKKEA